MSHVLKLILRILLGQNEMKIDQEISINQLGFRPRMGTREGIFNLRTIMEGYLEFGKGVYICFIDYEKAFDRVYHEQIMKCLDRIEMDDKDKRLISTIYWEQKAAVRLEQGLSEPFEIRNKKRSTSRMRLITYTFQSIYRIQFPRKR